MNPFERPAFFYLFRKGDDIEIRKMTDTEAAKLWDQGTRWLDVAKKTLSEAQQLRLHLLASRPPTTQP